ncbi:hypothetical protein JAO73_10175 [Hymenobacter sp. BT523]|uniref:hypothetical protein n=1 Tax=Hymenobacter sp. BT523 TaxID=2795725 RepID=UPI0018EDD0B1|nr:hypothetical protein [Hymenobacter sp. BT523]MBJ6109381.1 hypothetical protein [Hymenobacter sp. BT523]
MQNLDSANRSLLADARAFPDGQPEAEEVVVFELLVPGAAKVPPQRQYLEVASLVVLPSSVSSTVPSTIVTDLRVSDTARRLTWKVTATLTAPPAQARRH